MTATHHDLGGVEKPLRLLARTLHALDIAGIPAVIIGSLSLLEHLPEGLRSLINTDDADVMVWIASEEAMAALLSVLKDSLGCKRAPGHPGKWIAREGFLDVVGRTLPYGQCGDACFPEPFANVAFLDVVEPVVIRRAGLLTPLPATTRVAGALATCLGKTLKVARYLNLEDWPVNVDRQARAARSLRDIMLLIEANPENFSTEAVRALIYRCRTLDKSVAGTMMRALGAFVNLFGDGRPAFDLAERDGVTTNTLRVVQELARDLEHFNDEYLSTEAGLG